MKTDRELLEMAARAAGYKIEWVRNSGCYYRCEEEVGREEFNPLDDDGEAMRLAVVCRMTLEVSFRRSSAHAWRGQKEIVAREKHAGDDWSAFTRRAIVRAAAAIGEAMP